MAVGSGAESYRIAPCIERFYAGLHAFKRHETGRRNDADRISFLQVWWNLAHIISVNVVSFSFTLNLCFTPHLSAKFAF